MPPSALDPARELRRMIASGHLSDEALHAMTGIPSERLTALLGGTPPSIGTAMSEHVRYSEESARVWTLAAQLTEGLQIDDDDRLKAIIESLTIESRLSLDSIAKLTGLDADDVETALHDPRTLPVQRKYMLALRGSYLINAINQARGR